MAWRWPRYLCCKCSIFMLQQGVSFWNQSYFLDRVLLPLLLQALQLPLIAGGQAPDGRALRAFVLERSIVQHYPVAVHSRIDLTVSKQ